MGLIRSTNHRLLGMTVACGGWRLFLLLKFKQLEDNVENQTKCIDDITNLHLHQLQSAVDCKRCF